MVTSLANMKMLQSQESYRTTTDIFGMYTKGTERRTITQYDARLGSGQRNLFLMTVLNSFLLLTLYGARMTLRQFT
jgi:hypothetical protein